MNKLIRVLFFALIVVGSCHATVTIQFAYPYFGNIPSNLANFSGTVTDGMRFGIVVDTTGNGFSSTQYDAYAGGGTTAGFLSASGASTDDYYIPGLTTVDGTSSPFFESDFTTIPGHGSILDDMPPITLGANGVSTGDKFALIWLATNSTGAGDHYGLLTDASFVLPSEPFTGPFDTPFAGNDPVRSASFTFQSTLAPEPSRVLLVGVGLVCSLFRRRRSR